MNQEKRKGNRPTDGHADETSVYYPPRTSLQKDAERLWFLFENNPTMYFIVDPEGVILSANRYGAEHLGYDVSELIGKQVLALVHEEDRPQVQANLTSCTSDPGQVCRWDFRKVRKDGTVIWIHEMVRPVLDENGEFIILVVCDDVTATKRLERDRERLLDAERQAREQVMAILESISDAFIAVDEDWRFTYMNGRGRQLVEALRGEPDEELIGQRLPDALPEIWNSSFGEYHRQTMEERRTIHHEGYLEAWGRWFQVHSYPSAGGLSLYVQDITDRKLAEQERERLFRAERQARAEAQRQRETLERISESRAHLMRGFSHDVKNPLGAADGFAALLEDGVLGKLSEKQREGVGRIRRSIHTSLRLIHDLLELARAETGQIGIEKALVDLVDVVRNAVTDVAPRARAAELDLELDATSEVSAYTDPARVQQVLENLLSNAVKYTDEGVITVRVRTRQQDFQGRPGSWVAVSVSDSGRGIPDAQRGAVFQEFSRVGDSTREGAGVGLAISRRIARLLNGEITLESQVGRGSTFTLWLPRSTQPEPML